MGLGLQNTIIQMTKKILKRGLSITMIYTTITYYGCNNLQIDINVAVYNIFGSYNGKKEKIVSDQQELSHLYYQQ